MVGIVSGWGYACAAWKLFQRLRCRNFPGSCVCVPPPGPNLSQLGSETWCCRNWRCASIALSTKTGWRQDTASCCCAAVCRASSAARSSPSIADCSLQSLALVPTPSVAVVPGVARAPASFSLSVWYAQSGNVRSWGIMSTEMEMCTGETAGLASGPWTLGR